MRFCANVLLGKGMHRQRHPGLAGAQHEVRHRVVRALPARPAAGLPGRPGRRLRAGPTAARRQGALMTDDKPADSGRLEVRLLRRLPAHPARLRGRAADPRRPGPDRALPRGVAARCCPARTTCRSSRARSPRPPTLERIQRGPRAVEGADHDRCVRDRGRHPGAAQLRRRRASSASAVYASPQYIDTPGHVDADLRARAGRLRAARLPDRQAPADRGDLRRSWPGASPMCPTPASAPSASGAA